MGGHMAANLLKHGHALTVFDMSSQATAKLVALGARKAASPAEVASNSTVVITMLPSSPHVKEVYTSANSGILQAVRKGCLLIDSSTIDPATAREVAAQAHRIPGVHMVDAPVSGGVGGAEGGTLTFMVGGSVAAFDLAKPVLACMGKNIVHCGDAGTGQVAKVANNLVLAISMIAVSEGMNLGTALGMDASKLAGIFNTSSARCWSSDTYNPYPGVMSGVPSSRDYSGGFGVDLMLKDVGLAMDAARTAGVLQSPMGQQAQQLYQQVSKLGLGNKDFSVVFQVLQQANLKPKNA
jgi:3-hydroxyisobutyrate dehydrogenase